MPWAAVIPKARASSWVKCLITLLEKNMKRKPTRARNPAWGYLWMASGNASISGVDIRTPAAKHIR